MGLLLADMQSFALWPIPDVGMDLGNGMFKLLSLPLLMTTICMLVAITYVIRLMVDKHIPWLAI